MASQQYEVDDFGLPIRKWAPPPEETDKEQAGDAPPSRPDTAEATVAAHTSKAEDDAELKNNQAAADDKSKAYDSSDEDDFKDAPSTPQVEAAGVGTKVIDSPKVKDDNPRKTETSPVGREGAKDRKLETESSEATSPTVATPAAEPSIAAPSVDSHSQNLPSTEEPAEKTGEEKSEAASKAENSATGTDHETPRRTSDGPVSPGEGQDNTTENSAGHARNTSTLSAGVGEFSHQQTATKPEEENEKVDDWQEMPSFAPYDIYDDDNKLVAKERTEEDEEKDHYGYGSLGGAGKGYTRVIMDDDAESATSMDDNTKYLFKGVNGTNVVEEEEEDQRDAVSQMQATKDLLTEGQRIAYVGLTRLEIVQLVKEAESVEKVKAAKKEVTMAAEATKMWGQKMMIRLYVHMDISAAEQIMVEQLSDHGVIPADLTPLLMANARVKNPMAKKENDETTSIDAEDPMSPGDPRSPKSESLTSPRPDGYQSPRTPSRLSLPDSPDDEEPAAPPPPYEAHPEGEMPDVKMPDQLPTTQNLEIDLRWTVLCDLFLILIADSTYDARSRLLLERVGMSLEIDWLEIRKFEKKVTDALEMQQQAEKENWNEDEHMESRRKQALKKRYVMMGLATVGGGLVIGLSAGLLAPLIGAGLAAGFTTIGVTGTGAFLGGAGGAAIITTAAASSGGVVGVRAANRRTGAVKTFEYRPLHNNKRVHLIVSVSGWMTGKVDDVRLPFSTVDPIMGDLYSVLWEPEMLRSTGDTMNILATEVGIPASVASQNSRLTNAGSHSRSSASPWKHSPHGFDGCSTAAPHSLQACLPD